MSRVVVSNINSPNATTVAAPLTMSTANTLAGAAIVDNNSVYFLANSSVNCTINTTSIYLNGINIVAEGTNALSTVIFSGNVTPAALTSNASAWNPDSTDIAYIIRVSANSASNTANTAYGQNYEAAIFGFSAGTSGQIYTIQNIGAQKIYFRTEDTTTETTAANRFNFPNHVVLDGGMSMELYYDGTLARWRMLDSINIPFEHKQALTKGFFGGGAIAPTGTTLVTTTEKITYSTETLGALTSGAGLSQARIAGATSGNADKGFMYGGANSPTTYSATADRATYSTETIFNITASNLTTSRGAYGSAGNSDKGFSSGGQTPTIVATSDRTTYSTETTAAVTGTNLVQSRKNLAAAGNSDKGFFSAGISATPAYITTAERTTYSTETNASVSGANLSQGRSGHAAYGNVDKGFFAGGTPGPVRVTTTDRTRYSTETNAAVTGANLSVAREPATSAAGNLDKGFVAGGYTGNGPLVATTDRTTYSTETTAAAAGANLGTNRGAGIFGV